MNSAALRVREFNIMADHHHPERPSLSDSIAAPTSCVRETRRPRRTAHPDTLLLYRVVIKPPRCHNLGQAFYQQDQDVLLRGTIEHLTS